MNKDFLEKLGIDAKLIKEIIVEHGKGIEKFKTLVKTSEDALGVSADALKVSDEQLVAANTTIDGFKKLDPKAIQKAATEWETKAKNFETLAEKTKKDGEAQVQALKYDHALAAALTVAGVKDPADIIPHLKREDIKLDKEGKLVGLSEQLEPLQETKDYLFNISEEEEEDDSDADNPKIIMGSKSKSVVSDSVIQAARIAAGLADPGD